MQLKVGLSLAVVLVATGCTSGLDVAKARSSTAHATSARDEALAKASLADFEGDWAYANDCEFGHYASLSLKRTGEAMSGEWSDGTRVRGSDGQLHGVLQKNRLILQRCTQGDERGGEPYCPRFDTPHDFLERRGASLVWYRNYGDEATQYLVLERSPPKAPRDQGCEQDKEGQDDQ